MNKVTSIEIKSKDFGVTQDKYRVEVSYTDELGDSNSVFVRVWHGKIQNNLRMTVDDVNLLTKNSILYVEVTNKFREVM